MRAFLRGLIALSGFTFFLPFTATGAESEFLRELEAWRTERVARLTAPDGWLSIIGLHWLEEGVNTIGASEENHHRLASGPAHLGRVELAPDRTVRFWPAKQVSVAVGDMVIDGRDETGIAMEYGGPHPTIVRAGSLSLFVIERGKRLALRVRDSEAPRRKEFSGIDYFPADPSWRIEATWVPFAPVRQIPITNAVGQTTLNTVPGKAVFSRDGQKFELLPITDSSGETLFFIIADATSGLETYEASRFLYAPAPKDGKVILDFNRAQNPPCAFTPFATCPLPPKENRLSLRITAGEKNYRGAH